MRVAVAPCRTFRTAVAAALLVAAIAGGAIGVVATAGRLHQRPPASPAIAGERFVFQSDDGSSMELWLSGDDPRSARRLLRSAQHAAGWSGRASVSPDGSSIAYTRLPLGARDPDRQAELWSVRIADGDATLLATEMELRVAPVWSADSRSVYYQRIRDAGAQIWRQRASGGMAELIAQAVPGTAMLPIGDEGTPDSLLCARFDRRGTDLVKVGRSGDQRLIAHISDETARDLQLSPDAQQLAFLAPTGGLGAPAESAGIVELATGSVRRLTGDWGAIAGLTWRPNGGLLIGTLGPTASLMVNDGTAATRAAVTDSGGRVLTERGPRGGFDQPLHSSPSGRATAIRHFSGDSVAEPGAASDQILRDDGATTPIARGAPARFVGWLDQSG